MSPTNVGDEDFLDGPDVDNIAPLRFNDVRTVDEILEKEPESPRSDVKDDSSFEDEKKMHANALALEGEFDGGFRHGDETLVAAGVCALFCLGKFVEADCCLAWQATTTTQTTRRSLSSSESLSTSRTTLPPLFSRGGSSCWLPSLSPWEPSFDR